MEYEPIETIVSCDGLRVVLVQGFPSPWGQAAKAMIEYKGLLYRAAPLIAGTENIELIDWAGINSAPVVAWDTLAPVNRWDDILFLLERLAPEKKLLPEKSDERALCLGLAHLICGELGIGWNRRLNMFHPSIQSGKSSEAIQNMASKYGYNDLDVRLANRRVASALFLLSDTLKKQKAKGEDYFVGNQVTAVDFYWTAFSNLCELMPQEICPLEKAVLPMFENVPKEVISALDTTLLEHRDMMMQKFFKIPMEL